MARMSSFDKGKVLTMIFGRSDSGSDYVRVSTFFDYLSQGKTVDAFLKAFPTVRREQVTAKLTEALELLYERTVADSEQRLAAAGIPRAEGQG